MAVPVALRGRRIGAGRAFTAGAFVCAALLLWISWHLRRQTDFLDLRIYRDAIRFRLHGHSLYAFQEPGTHNHLGFTYPPFAALVLMPLAVMGLGQAQALFAVLNVAICAACGTGFGLALARRFGWPGAPAAVLGTAMVLSLEPIRESIGFGQVNIVLLGLVSLDLWLLSTGRRGGTAIGIAAAIKLTPAVLILALFAARRRDAGRRALLAAASATAAAAAILPDSSWRYWSRELWQTSRVGQPKRITNQSWSGVLARWYDVASPPRLEWALGACAALVAALLVARRLSGWWASVRLLTIAGAASTVASPISWTHHYWWAVPAVAALAYRAVQTRSAVAVGAFAAVYALFVVGPIRMEQALHHRLWLGHAAADLYLYATLLACLALLPGSLARVRTLRAVKGQAVAGSREPAAGTTP